MAKGDAPLRRLLPGVAVGLIIGLVLGPVVALPTTVEDAFLAGILGWPARLVVGVLIVPAGWLLGRAAGFAWPEPAAFLALLFMVALHLGADPYIRDPGFLLAYAEFVGLSVVSYPLAAWVTGPGSLIARGAAVVLVVASMIVPRTIYNELSAQDRHQAKVAEFRKYRSVLLVPDQVPGRVLVSVSMFAEYEVPKELSLKYGRKPRTPPDVRVTLLVNDWADCTTAEPKLCEEVAEGVWRLKGDDARTVIFAQRGSSVMRVDSSSMSLPQMIAVARGGLHPISPERATQISEEYWAHYKDYAP